MSSVLVDYIKDIGTSIDPYNSVSAGIPPAELRHQIVKVARSSYRGGSWLPSTGYQWMPNGYIDYTPARGDTQIRFTISLSYAFVNGHCITHNIFYAAGSERGRHSISGHHYEHRHTYVWQLASWGVSNQRIGYQSRNYSGGNQALFHGTGYWDGAGSNQAAQSEIYIEEFLAIP